MRTRAERRKNDYRKAVRKKRIAEECMGVTFYNNTHQYSKNKIHCSCPLCSAKTGKSGNTPNRKHSEDMRFYDMNDKETAFYTEDTTTYSDEE